MSNQIKILLIVSLALSSIPAFAMERNVKRVKLVIQDGLNMQLLEAADRGDLKAVRNLIADDANVNAIDKHKRSVLIRAAQNGHKSVVEYLIGAGADLDARDGFDWTALKWAVYYGHIEVVECLIQAGADVVAKYHVQARSALKVAWMHKNQPICELLVETMLGLRRSQRDKALAYAAAFCMRNVENNGRVLRDLIDPVADRMCATQCIGYEKTLEEVNDLEGEMQQALLAKYFPDEVNKN